MQAPTTTSHNNALDSIKRPLFLGAVFIVIFISARLVIHPFNDVDYYTFTHGVQAAWNGQSPYSVQGYFSPPWSIIFLTPVYRQPIETWLALDVAIFATMMLDLGTPPGLLLLFTPAFITLLASSNAEWLMIGPGLWLLYRARSGWLRGVAWLLLTCKPQSVIVLLVFDGWAAIKIRDWKAFLVAGIVSLISLAIYPQFMRQIQIPLDWSISVLARYGLVGAVIATVFIIFVRRNRLDDYKTLGIQLSPVWTPYILQYSYVPTAFTMRKAGAVRTLIYVIVSLGLAVAYWQGYHEAEHIGALGMVLLAALLAPDWKPLDSRGKKLSVPTATSAEMETTPKV
ncbi:MAG TPA: hypothetical protein VKQ72_05630 [Aggregatilineales bacterium]|nr:hypothetical protein [Aggregatilineales bacterium]